MNFLKSEKFKVSAVSIILVALGIALCVASEDLLGSIEIACAILSILVGVIFLLAFCFAPDFARNLGQILVGIFAMAIGTMIIFVPSTLVLGVCVFGGILGTKRITLSVDTKILGDKKFYIDFIFGILIYVLSVSILVLNMVLSSSRLVILLLGIGMIIIGVLYVVVTFALKRNNENLVKLINDSGYEILDNSDEAQ